MNSINFTKLFLIFITPIYCYSQQLSEIPASVNQKAKEYCNGLSNINSFSGNYKIDLANRYQIDPSSIRVYSYEYRPSVAQTGDDNFTFNYFTAYCKVIFAHPKGVHEDTFYIPNNLTYKYNIVKRKPVPPEEQSKKDYRDDFPNLYTPPGFIRNKRGDLVYY